MLALHEAETGCCMDADGIPSSVSSVAGHVERKKIGLRTQSGYASWVQRTYDTKAAAGSRRGWCGKIREVRGIRWDEKFKTVDDGLEE